MTPILRQVLGAFRARLEGAVFALLVGRDDTARGALLRRDGLRPYRQLWWTSCRLESVAAIWRQVLLLERIEKCASAWVPLKRGGTLVVAMGHLGDAMQTLPLLRALRAARAGERLGILTGPWSAALFVESGLADEVHVYEPALEQYRRSRRGGADMREALRALEAVARKGYAELISTGPTDWASFAAVRAVRPERWVGVAPRPGFFAATGQEELRPYERNRRESERILRLANLGDASPELFWPNRAQAAASARRLLAEVGCNPDAPFAVLAPGGGWSGKLWPAARFAEVGEWIRRERLMNVFVVGSSGERALGDTVCAGRDGFWNLCGRSSLEAFMGLVAEARLVVCNDSAALHFAAAAGVPTVSLFGPTSPAQWAPSGAAHCALRPVTDCPNCTPWHPRARCVDPTPCMGRIRAEDVIAAVSSVCPGPAARAS